MTCMSYMKRLAERLDEIIADPRQPHEELRAHLLRFLFDEVRRSYWTGVRLASEGRVGSKGEARQEDDVVTVSRME